MFWVFVLISQRKSFRNLWFLIVCFLEIKSLDGFISEETDVWVEQQSRVFGFWPRKPTKSSVPKPEQSIWNYLWFGAGGHWWGHTLLWDAVLFFSVVLILPS